MYAIIIEIWTISNPKCISKWKLYIDECIENNTYISPGPEKNHSDPTYIYSNYSWIQALGTFHFKDLSWMSGLLEQWDYLNSG